jgi:dienelactone hydrolase
MNTQYLDYTDDELTCEAFVAYDGSQTSRRPCVLIFHQWSGQSDAERKKAEQLAQLGYVGFAIDIYGKGVRGGLSDDNTRLMQPFLNDRAMLRQRILAGLAAAQKHPLVDPDRIGAIGYCFGGLCVLDLARSAAPDVKGVVSIHGVFHPPNLGMQAPITAKVLILHGYDDPLATPEQVLAIARELTDAKADWQIHAYGHTMHAFTAAGVDVPEHGLRYSAAADRRSWVAMKNFLEEILA